MPKFVPGVELSRALYVEHVAGLLGGVSHAAALLGEGSEVLGFDTERSTDHAWGPRLHVFVAAEDVDETRARIDGGLPDEVLGWPTRFYRWQTDEVAHHVEVEPLGPWLERQLGFDPREGVTTAQWLATPLQSLLHVTAGPVLADGDGELSAVRERLSWYTRDVWLWAMAAAWQRVQDNEHVVGRTAETGDDLGNRLVVAKLVRHLTSLCFLQEKRYAPYVKWFGAAFARLDAAAEIGPSFDRALASPDPVEREDAVASALEAVARRHNDLGLTEHLDPATGPFDVKINDAVRPFRVLNANRLVNACSAAIESEQLRDLAPVGAIDQLLDPNDLISNFTDWPRELGAVYARKLGES